MTLMKTGMERIIFCVHLLLVFIGPKQIDAAISDWFWSTSDVIYKNGDRKGETNVVNIPFELKTEDEKFLEEALKFTDIMKSSALDVCQHNVVLKIKTSCSSMTEEDLSKMSVNLLNCQSAVDGRKTFPCTESMSLKQCTKDMDANMWNAYHLMNNRARAVCLASRRDQFQALSEMTVKKLLTTAQEQIRQLGMLQDGQEELEILTTRTMGAVHEGNVNIMLQQDQLKEAQATIQNSVVQNLKDLSLEKSLIAAGNRELDAIKFKLDQTNQELSLQSLERSGQHQQVIADIEKIRSQAAAILKRIEDSTTKLMAHHTAASAQYEETLRNLKKINSTVGFLTQLFTTTHAELEERIEWIKSFLGESGEELAKVSSTFLHIAYLLMGMLVSSFLHLPFVSRAFLILLLPLNLLLVHDKRAEALKFSEITTILVCITLVNVFINYVLSRKSKHHDDYVFTNGMAKQPEKLGLFQKFKSFLKLCWQKTCEWFKKVSSEEAIIKPSANDYSFASSTGREPEDNNVTYTPSMAERRKNEPINRVSRWLESSRFEGRSGSPISTASIRSGSPKAPCSALCKTGRPCRNASTPGRDFCRRHLSGSSIIE